MKYLVIKDNYVVDTIIWDGVTPYKHPVEGAELIPDTPEHTGATEAESVGKGAWYERAEGRFMNYIGGPHTDAPEELVGGLEHPGQENGEGE